MRSVLPVRGLRTVSPVLSEPGVDAHKTELAEGIVDDLEGQRGKRLVVVRLADHDGVEMS